MAYTIRLHYAKGDLKGDYCSVDVFLDDDLLAEFGDGYHDNGLDKAWAFVHGHAMGASDESFPLVDTEHIDDWDESGSGPIVGN